MITFHKAADAKKNPHRTRSGKVGQPFSVAPFFLPADMTRGLITTYGFARFVDDIGDMALSADEERLAT